MLSKTKERQEAGNSTGKQICLIHRVGVIVPNQART